MSSVKKVGKSRKTKVMATRAAAKSRRGGVKTAKRQAQPKARTARPAAHRARRSSVKPVAKRTGSAKTKARKPANSARTRAVAARGRASALARLKKAGARPARVSARKPASPIKGRRKAAQAPRLAKAKQAARGKSRHIAQPKLTKGAPRQPASRNEATAQKVLSERRAHAAAVMALRATSGKPASHGRELASLAQKAQKKALGATPQPPRPGVPAAARYGVPGVTPAPQGQQAFGARPGDIRLPAIPKPPGSVKLGFKPTEFIVYPAHGVGQILAIEEQEVAGFKLELFVISFAKDKMILKVPTPKTVSVGMRKLAGPDVVKQALTTLTGRARIKRTMWSRRAQEYEAKINSGDLVAIAEVVRDLYRSEAQPEQSYSERQLYEAALDRVARELAVVQKLTETELLKLIELQLQKGPRRTKAEEVEADTEVAASEDGVEEAA